MPHLPLESKEEAGRQEGVSKEAKDALSICSQLILSFVQLFGCNIKSRYSIEIFEKTVVCKSTLMERYGVYIDIYIDTTRIRLEPVRNLSPSALRIRW